MNTLVSRSLLTLLLFLSLHFLAQAQVPAPEDVFGFRVGDDYKLADYDQMLDYYQKLDAASDRVQMIEIGKSVTGRPIKLMFISTAENLQKLDRWREISEQLARARISPAEAEQLVQEGKAIVWFDGGMHATERAHAQMTSELAYKIATEETAEMRKIRENVITLIVPVINPDGVDIVVDWYRKNLGTPFETSPPPILYQKYVGHDNNRDWFMNNMPETRAATRVLYSEWYPQIVHNHHQTSPAWARIFLPPFRSPVNPRIHPGVTTGVNLVGTAMANRFAMKKMPGVVSGTNFSMWWNGGMRTAPYYHNMIGILTEVAHATPTPRYYDPKDKPSTIAGIRADGSEVFYPYPWEGGESHFRDAVDYMLTASMGVLDIAADRREEFLHNIYLMGRDAIENKDEAFAYIIPKKQWDASEARNLVEILQRGGLEAHRATADFEANGKKYAAGSVIFYSAQAFRPFLVDLLEKQAYPDQYAYPGGPPRPPYDLAGWTLPMQMGVTVDRIDDAFEAPTAPLNDLIAVESGALRGKGRAGYVFSNRQNTAYTVVNDLLRAGLAVRVIHDSLKVEDTMFTSGAFWVSGRNIDKQLETLAAQTGVHFHGLPEPPNIKTQALKKIKVGLYKSWMANMDEGWTRWVLEQHHFDLDTLHNADMQRADDLLKYSAIIIPSQSTAGIMHGWAEDAMPEGFTGGLGLDGVVALDNYVQRGGTLITFDEASDFAIEQFGLPVRNVTERLSDNQFFIPGSLVRTKVDTKHPLAFGMPAEAAASFSRSRAFEISKRDYRGEGGREDIAKAPEPEADIVVEFADRDLLMSGWANGEERYLKGKAALVQVPHGTGKIVLFSFRPQFRGQPRGTYKLIFNSILSGGSASGEKTE
jgi:hypothetical protein